MNIFLADASADVRLALQVLVDNEPGMDVVGIAVHVKGLREQVLASKPDVLILDCNLPGQPQACMLTELKSAAANLKVIALTISGDIHDCALADSADASFSKTFSAHDLVETLRAWRDDLRRRRASTTIPVRSEQKNG